MLEIGLCSVTFRNKSIDEIIQISVDNGLNFIEWGGDVHLKPGDFETANYIKNKCYSLDIKTSYGSYFKYREEDDFELNLQTAKYLNTSDIRIWAKRIPSSEISLQDYNNFINISKKYADLALKYGIRINFENHRNTLTDTTDSALKMLNDIGKDNVLMYWQPQAGENIVQRLNSIKRLKNKLSKVHVFNWDDNFNRYALESAEEEWIKYAKELGNNRTYLIEFVKDDSEEQFANDVKALKKIIGV